MALSLHTLTPAPGSRSRSFRIGRGNASGRGTTAGRGTKGQRARTGGRNRLKLKGIKQMLLAFPKSRGFQSGFAEVYTVRMANVVKAFDNGSLVNLATLKEKGLIPRIATVAKLVAGGDVTKKFTIQGVRASASVKAAIEKAGGTFAV